MSKGFVVVVCTCLAFFFYTCGIYSAKLYAFLSMYYEYKSLYAGNQHFKLFNLNYLQTMNHTFQQGQL